MINTLHIQSLLDKKWTATRLSISIGVQIAALECVLLSLGRWLYVEAAVPDFVGPLSMLSISALVLAPYCETVLFQVLPIELALACRYKTVHAFQVSASIFIVCHVLTSGSAGIIPGCVGGLFLGFTYVYCRPWGRLVAALTVAGAHITANLLVLILFLLLR